MRQVLFAVISSVTFGVIGQCAIGQEADAPYGPFDAIAEGASSSEAQRLSLINSQLETVDHLRSVTVPVRAPRVIYSGEPRVAAVYAYGRRGLLGLRPRGYVVIRRSPIAVYAPPSFGPPDPPVEPFGYPYREGVRQPIGHESLQTGPNRWEYRPLYADDDALFDESHRQIEERLGPGNDTSDGRSTARPAAPVDPPNEPEELPLPDQVPDPPRAAKQASARGAARDIARDEQPTDENNRVGAARPTRRAVVPPPPTPDPPVHVDQREVEGNGARAKEREASAAPAKGDAVRGPRLNNPSTGTREF